MLASHRCEAFVLIIFILFSCSKKFPDYDVSLGSNEKQFSPELFTANKLDNNNAGFIVYDISEKHIEYSHNREKLFIPASVTKVLTMIAALDILGPEYRFKTILGFTGDLDEGIINGDLYVKGTGDPLFTLVDLEIMAEKLHEQGVRRIAGRFIFDEQYLIPASAIDRHMDDDASYNTGVSALSLDSNVMYAEWGPDDNNAQSSKAFLIPTLRNNGISLSKQKIQDTIWFSYGNMGGRESWNITADAPKKGREQLPVKWPGRYTAEMFAKICRLRGISVPDPVPGVLPKSYNLVIEYPGKPLLEIVEVVLKYSNNLMAELLLLSSVKEKTGTAVEALQAAQVMARHIQSKFSNTDWAGFKLVNGSGLSGKCRISPEQMLMVLLYADSKTFGGRRFISLLPVSGWKWSMMTRLNTPESAFHVWAKTGTINYAIALAGYFYGASGKLYAFDFFINDIEKRKRYEMDPARRNKKSSREADTWIEENKKSMDAVIVHMIKNL